MDKLLIISGPTATGKTNLALKLANQFGGQLISADSRQIYKGMDIGTGKDHPENIHVNLINLVSPNQSFSVAQYQKLAVSKIKDIQSQNKLPIVVGGTGQYIDSIINPNLQTFYIKPNRILRFFLNRLSLNLLQNIYSLLDNSAFKSLNNSEKHNSHRLIRKIEIKLLQGFYPHIQSETKESFNILHLSLTAPNEFLFRLIDQRVENRLSRGLLEEISGLLSNYSWNHPGLNTLAYKEFKPYFIQKNSTQFLEASVARWKFDEHGLARRQKTWFKKQKDIFFFDITAQNYPLNLIDFVTKWYNKS